MIELTPATVLAVFLIFCRIGACLMLMPGFSSSRIPMKVRLFLAIAVTLALAPLLLDDVLPRVGGGAPADMLSLIFAELLAGMLIGLLGRLFFMALQAIGVAITQSIGLTGMPGMGIEEDEMVPPMVTLLSLTALTLMFLTDQHWLLVGGLLDSYDAIPVGEGFSAQFNLVEVADQLTAVFLLALRIGSPFLIYSIVVNFAVGLTNKLTPQIPVYFIAMPFVTTGGLVLLYFTIVEFTASFTDAFGSWLATG